MVEQALILEKLDDLIFPINPKIWLAIKWLRTYISISLAKFWVGDDYTIGDEYI